MQKTGTRCYFDDYSEVFNFMMDKKFNKLVPQVPEDDLKNGTKRYVVELQNDEVVWAAVECTSRTSCEVYPFYDVDCQYYFSLKQVMAISEASEKWEKAVSTIRKAIINPDRNLFNSNEARKSGGVFIVTEQAMKRVYGPQKEKVRK